MAPITTYTFLNTCYPKLYISTYFGVCLLAWVLTRERHCCRPGLPALMLLLLPEMVLGLRRAAAMSEKCSCTSRRSLPSFLKEAILFGERTAVLPHGKVPKMEFLFSSNAHPLLWAYSCLLRIIYIACVMQNCSCIPQTFLFLPPLRISFFF